MANVTDQISEVVKVILEAQSRGGVESGMDKTVINLQLVGKGSKKVVAQLGGSIKIKRNH